LGFTGDYEHHFSGETQQSVAYLVERDPFNPTYAELSNSGYQASACRTTLKQPGALFCVNRGN
jgi:hypothetical protein